MGLRPWSALLLVGTLAGCSGQMADQPSMKTGEVSLLPASGSISMMPRKPWATPIPPGSATGSLPVGVSSAALANGKQLYADYCIFCHGAEGRGDGPVGEVFAPRPRNLLLPTMKQGVYPDARIYEVITNGYSTMPAFYERLSPEERWSIVAYVRELQRAGQ